MSITTIMKNENLSKQDRKRKYSLICLGISAFIGAFSLLAGILVVVYFRGYVEGLVRAEIPIVKGSRIAESWKAPPVKPLLKIYFFNITNAVIFQNPKLNVKPKLEEVGPYVYEERWERVNVSWSSDDEEVNFGTKKTYMFRPDLSSGSEDDLMMLPNIPMISALRSMKYSGHLVKVAFQSMLEILKQTIISPYKVKDVLWGVDHPLVKLANDILPEEKRLPTDMYGFFVGKNQSTDGILTMRTGKSDIQRIGEILALDGKDRLSKWNGDECNKIRGGDGSVFHPDILMNETLRVFSKDICRSLPLVFEKEIDTNGVPGYRFIPPPNIFAKPTENPSNQCFYNKDEPYSTPFGLFNVSKCQHDTPLFVSWPHFYQADPELLEKVIGLNPDKSKHQFYIDVQPKLGNGLGAAGRIQINVHLEELGSVADKNIKNPDEGKRDVILPIFWSEEVVGEIEDEETLALLHKGVHAPQVATTGLSFVFFIVGIVLLVLVPVVFLACYKWRKLTAKTTNYVVNGASRKVSVDQKHKNGIANGTTLKKENSESTVKNGNTKSNGVAEKNGNEKVFPELNGKLDA